MTGAVNWALIIIGALLVLVEVLLGAISGFDFLLIGSAILLGGICGIIVDSAPIGIATAGLLSLAYVLLGRNKIRARLRRKGLPSNTDALLGRIVRVSDRIARDHAGRIKWEGEEWRAVPDGAISSPIEPGDRVRVTRIEGVTAFIVPVESEQRTEGETP